MVDLQPRLNRLGLVILALNKGAAAESKFSFVGYQMMFH